VPGADAGTVLMAGAVAVVIIAVCAFAFTSEGGVAAALFRLAAVIIGVLAVWALLDRAAISELQAERRALDQRAAELSRQAMAPGSPLACLDALAGDAVESACERALFASAEMVAAAVSYVSARLTLLADDTDHANRAGVKFESTLAPLRLAMEGDRFGIVAHVFSMRDSCTALQCDALALLHNSSRVEANLRDRTFDGYVTRHAVDWAKGGAPPPTAAVSQPAAPSDATLPRQPAAATSPSPRFDFPSAASIPPVSIMTAEPTAPAPPVAPAAPTPPRKSQR
jgi:hypothetical protein